MTITVKVNAGAKTRSIVKLADGTYKVRTPIAPEKGKATDDVVDMLADYFGVPRSHVELVSGAYTPLKVFKIMA